MSTWTKEKEIALINKMQDEYVDELIQKLHSTESSEVAMKFINFTSPTGTGKTKMMAKLINKLSDDFFIITTLSKGQLNQQVQNSLSKDCYHDNYVVFGAMSLKTNSIMKEKDLIDILPLNKKVYWIRDEGHINTNKWSAVLESKCNKIINFSATNKEDGGIVCNFMNTLMLRTVTQKTGDIDAALQKLIEVKNIHEDISGYNPCALFRVMSTNVEQEVLKKCEEYNLKAVTLIDNDDYRTADLCEDDNEYDVIINKQKLTEGIDIRRAHVLWMENQPSNQATTIQAIGRCRRNALLWRADIDILAPENKKLLEQTRECFVFYNVKNMKVDTDETGELAIEFCPYVSVEKLKPGHTIYVKNGQMPNGLFVAELEGCTGEYGVYKDPQYGFNWTKNPTVYKKVCIKSKFKETDITKITARFADEQYCKNFIKTYNENRFGRTYVNPEKTIAIEYSTVIDFFGNIKKKELPLSLWQKRNWHKSFFEKITKNNEMIEKYGYFENSRFLKQKENNTANIYLVYDEDEKERGITLNKTIVDQLFNIISQPHTLNNIYYFWISTQYQSFIPYNYYKIIYNNMLLGLLNYQLYQSYKSTSSNCEIQHCEWQLQKGISSHIGQRTKLDRFINEKYSQEIAIAESQLYNGKNNFSFTKKMNSCLGYCAEYYAKYLLYGIEFFRREGGDFYGDYYDKQSMPNLHNLIYLESHGLKVGDIVIIRQCILKYLDTIKKALQLKTTRMIPTFSYKQLCSEEMTDFIKAVCQLGTKAAVFVKEKLNVPQARLTDPALSTSAFVGLTDLMDQETIIDIKCTNHIDINMVKQVLAYQFLSLFRSDLHIKRVIVYDAVADKFVEIPITEKNQKIPE